MNIEQGISNYMENTKFTKENSEKPPRIIMVWDFPTRLFHWLLVILVIISFVTGNIGGYHNCLIAQ
jgi:cytochrome b